MKKLIALMALALTLTACGGETDTVETEEETVIEEPTQEETEQEEVKEEPKEELGQEEKEPEKEIEVTEETKENLSNEDAKTLVTAFTKSQFKDMCDVSTETMDGIFVIHIYPKDPDLKTEIAGLMLDKTNPQLLEGWNQMSNGLVEYSKSVKEQVDENVSIMLHNPVNTENVLFVTLNDTVVSDFTKEQ